MRIQTGDKVTYNDIAGDQDSFLRTGIVTEVKETDGGTLLILQHPERPSVMWSEWYRADSMVVTPGA